MASLIVNNVLTSSVEITYNYLDTDEIFGYTVRGTYEIDISDINLQQNDTVLLSGRDAIIEAYARPTIVARIGADDYTNGRISNFSFGAGSLVGAETVSITIEEGKRLDSYSETQFAKYIPNPHQVERFSENYNFSRNGSTYTSKRNVSLSYKQSAGDQFLNDAKTFLTNYYFANRPSLGYQEDGISENAKIDKGFRGQIVENYDLIGLEVTLTETVSSSFVDDSKNVGRDEKQTLAISEEGYLTKTFNIDLTSLRFDSQNILATALSEIVDEIKAQEEAEFGVPFSISKGITRDGNKANLTIAFSTDPNKSQENRESYSGREAKAGKFVEYDLNIEYKSDGKNNREKFQNSKARWVLGQTMNEERIQRLFHPKVPIYEKSRGTNFQKTEGFVSEGIKFTTDSSYQTSDDGVLKLKKTLSKTHQINRIEKLLDIGVLEERVVTREKRTVGQASVNASIVVSQSMGIHAAQQALESRTEEFNELVDENIIHIMDDVIKLNLGQGTASRTLSYAFLESW
tara:strand:+ start:436 stop:1986 length:1551 start_codon:yes stop_codon:yes gene_type:complete